jgi:hypothetical protein
MVVSLPDVAATVGNDGRRRGVELASTPIV